MHDYHVLPSFLVKNQKSKMLGKKRLAIHPKNKTNKIIFANTYQYHQENGGCGQSKTIRF
jgi:hypothetical protein